MAGSVRQDGYLRGDLLRGEEISTELLRDLPKADLHVHLDGSVRFATLVELYAEQGLELPGGSEDSLRSLLGGAGEEPSLSTYIPLFDVVHRVLQDEVSLRRVTRELVADCAAENVKHLEMRFSPVLHCERALDPEGATDAVLAGLMEGREETGISAELVITGLRHHSPKETHRLAELAVHYKRRGVVGFDLAGIEMDNPAKDHLEAFYLILNNNINCTVHAGEEFGPPSIHQALHYLGAHRIGHGTRLLEDMNLLRYVANHRIPLEVGLSSSVRTGAVKSIDRHPLRRFLRYGVRVTLCTNNRLLLDTDLTGELRRAVDVFDLSLLEMENILLAGFKSAFLSQQTRVELMRMAIEQIGEARRRHGLEVA